MLKIPDNVEEWDIGLISKMIHEGYDENEILEFKGTINEETKKIPITACAFVNTRGGTIILGVNNDRTKDLSLDQRLVGLEDSDDLKSKITNQLKNIKPDILVSNVKFKESNIKLLNGKVIVVMNISKSEKAPHQFEYKFYKRLSNGNEPMEIDEIRYKIIESEKNEALSYILLSDLDQLVGIINIIKKNLTNDEIKTAVYSLQHLPDVSSLTHFIFQQSYFYPSTVQKDLMMIHRGVRFLEHVKELFENIVELNDEDAKKVLDGKSKDEGLKYELDPQMDSLLKHIESVKKTLVFSNKS